MLNIQTTNSFDHLVRLTKKKAPPPSHLIWLLLQPDRWNSPVLTRDLLLLNIIFTVYNPADMYFARKLSDYYEHLVNVDRVFHIVLGYVTVLWYKELYSVFESWGSTPKMLKFI